MKNNTDAPLVAESTKESRKEYVKTRFPCMGNCDLCGLCKVFRGKDAELAYADYIDGIREFQEVTKEYR